MTNTVRTKQAEENRALLPCAEWQAVYDDLNAVLQAFTAFEA